MGTETPSTTSRNNEAMVDQDAETVESTSEASRVPPDGETAATPHRITFLYPQDTSQQLTDYFPKEHISKQAGQKVLIGRGRGSDILLNDECMPRRFVELRCEKNNSDPEWFIKNISNRKAVFVNTWGVRPCSKKLRTNEECKILNDYELKLEGLTFIVKLMEGDMNLGDYEVEVCPQGAADLLNRQWSGTCSSSSSSDMSAASAAELVRRQLNGSAHLMSRTSSSSAGQNCVFCGGGVGLCSNPVQPNTLRPAFLRTPQPTLNPVGGDVQNLTPLVANLALSGPGCCSNPQLHAPSSHGSGQTTSGYLLAPMQLIVVSPSGPGAVSTVSSSRHATNEGPPFVAFPASADLQDCTFEQGALPNGRTQPQHTTFPNHAFLCPVMPGNGHIVGAGFTPQRPSMASGHGGSGTPPRNNFSGHQIPIDTLSQGSGSIIQQHSMQDSGIVLPQNQNIDRLHGPQSMPCHDRMQYVLHQQQQQNPFPAQQHYDGHQYLLQQQLQQQHQQGTYPVQPESAMLQNQQQDHQQPPVVYRLELPVHNGGPHFITNPTSQDSGVAIIAVPNPVGDTILPAAPPTTSLDRLRPATQVTSTSPVQPSSQTPSSSLSEIRAQPLDVSGPQAGAVAVSGQPAQQHQGFAAAVLTPIPGSFQSGQNTDHTAMTSSAASTAALSSLTLPASNGNAVHLRMHDGIEATQQPVSDFNSLSSVGVHDLQASGSGGLRSYRPAGREPEEGDERQPEENDDP